MERNKYNVGELVQVKLLDEIDVDHSYGVGWNNEMNKYCGNTFRIHEIVSGGYNLEGAMDTKGTVNGNGYWIFRESWLEPADEKTVDISETEMMSFFNGIM